MKKNIRRVVCDPSERLSADFVGQCKDVRSCFSLHEDTPFVALSRFTGGKRRTTNG